MRFLPDPVPPDPPPLREAPWWTLLLFAGALLTVLATRWPWLCVKFESLFGVHVGPPAWQSTAGFTCLVTSLMIAVMALAESGTAASRLAVRPGSLLLAAIALVVLLVSCVQGPGTLRSVSAAWTPWFYLACASLPLLALACLRRWAVLRRR